MTITDDCEGVTAIAERSPDPEPLNTAGLTPGTQTARMCLEAAVNRNGGMFSLQSAFRPQEYQDHLREVWDKYQTVKNWPDTQCTNVGSNVKAEWERHTLGYRPAAVSRHTAGNAFDGTWGTLNDGVSIDDLAAGCSLSRPVPGDPVHFVH